MNQTPPNAVQIELVEGCNLRCDFCGLQGIREPKDQRLNFMEPSTLERLCQEMIRLDWNPRIEFAMHGEPTLHPQTAMMVNIVRRAMPRQSIMMTSNGGGLLKAPGPLKRLNELFAAGLNVFALDAYEYVNIAAKVREAIKFEPRDFRVQEYPEDPEASPHSRSRPNEHRLVFVQDISVADKGTHSHINNHAGSALPPNTKGHGKRCAKPFRELSVRWDGNVAICCNDWRGVFKCGNVSRDLDWIWDGPEMSAARKYLYHGMREGLEPCAGCDALSYRVGLLPDPLGKETLPVPGPADARIVAKAAKGESYTKPVAREWETVQLKRRGK